MFMNISKLSCSWFELCFLAKVFAWVRAWACARVNECLCTFWLSWSRLGKTSSWVQALLQDSVVREPRHALPWMASWKGQCRSANACRSQQQATWQRDIHRRLSHKGRVWLGVHDQAGWKDCTRRQWGPQSHDLQPDHGGRSSHTCNTVSSLPVWRADYTSSFSQTQWTSCKRWSLEWATPTGYKDFCGSSVLGTPESVGMNGQIDW